MKPHPRAQNMMPLCKRPTLSIRPIDGLKASGSFVRVWKCFQGSRRQICSTRHPQGHHKGERSSEWSQGGLLSRWLCLGLHNPVFSVFITAQWIPDHMLSLTVVAVERRPRTGEAGEVCRAQRWVSSVKSSES